VSTIDAAVPDPYLMFDVSDSFPEDALRMRPILLSIYGTDVDGDYQLPVI
jgi:hypothetical protein